MTELLDYNQVAAVLGVSKVTLRRYVRSGILPAVKVGPKVVRFDPCDVEAFIARGRSAPAGAESRELVCV